MADVKIGQVQSQQVALGNQQGKAKVSYAKEGMEIASKQTISRGMSSAIKNPFALPEPDIGDDVDVMTTAKGAMSKINKDLSSGVQPDGVFDFASMFAASAQTATDGVDDALQSLSSTGVMDNNFEERSKLAAKQQDAQQFQDRLGALLNNTQAQSQNENTASQMAEKFNQLMPNATVVGLKLGNGTDDDTARKMMAISCMISSRPPSAIPGPDGVTQVNPSSLLFKAQKLFEDKAIMGQSLGVQMNQPLTQAASQMFGRGGPVAGPPGGSGGTPVAE
jgi:hypothetical protein